MPIDDYHRYYYLANQERLRQAGREYHYKNKDRLNAYSRKYYEENRERIKAQRNARTARHEPKSRKRAHLVLPNSSDEMQKRQETFLAIQSAPQSIVFHKPDASDALPPIVFEHEPVTVTFF